MLNFTLRKTIDHVDKVAKWQKFFSINENQFKGFICVCNVQPFIYETDKEKMKIYESNSASFQRNQAGRKISLQLYGNKFNGVPRKRNKKEGELIK